MAKNEKHGGQYRQMLLEQRGQSEPQETGGGIYFRIRFYICLFLFVAYLILDYTKTSVGPVDSRWICTEIEKDLTKDVRIQEAWSKALHSIHISGSPDS